MTPATTPVGPPFGFFMVKYRMPNHPANDWRGWTTDRWYWNICKNLDWETSNLLPMPDTLEQVYALKKARVVELAPELRTNPDMYEIQELASWWYDPNTKTVDREGQNPGSSIQLGLYVSILDKLTDMAFESLNTGLGMTQVQLNAHTRNLNEALTQNEELRRIGLTVQGIRHMFRTGTPSPSPSLEEGFVSDSESEPESERSEELELTEYGSTESEESELPEHGSPESGSSETRSPQSESLESEAS